MKINGYCYINGDVSSDISPKGSKVPVLETIRAGALTISPNLFVNGHHTGAISAFAFAYDGSAKASWDHHGLRFQATLPDTFQGRDVRKALTDGLRLGTSVEFADASYEIVDGVREIVSGTLTGISLTRPGFAYYSKGGVWLADAAADTLPKDVRSLRNHWQTAPAPSASPRNWKQPSAAEEAERFNHWFALIKKQGYTLARLAAEGFRDDVIEQCRAAGLK